MTPSSPERDAEQGASFRRDLGPWSASALIAGSMIGTGIFFFVSPVAERLPSAPAIIAAWLVGAAIAACGAICLAELAAAYPRTGGIYVYLNLAFGPLVAFLYSWAKFFIMRVGSLTIPSLAFAGFAGDVFGWSEPQAARARLPVALAVIAVITVVNIGGVRFGGAVQSAFTLAKVLGLIAIVGVGLAFALGAAEPHPIDLVPAAPPEGVPLVLFLTALIPIMWTFGGWDESPFVAEEVRRPERNLPLSILGGLGVVGLLFVLVNGAYLAVLSPGEMAASGGLTATLAMQRALGPGARRMLGVLLLLSTFGAANGIALTGARIAYATGRDNAFFRWFARLDPRTGTPVRGLVGQALLACAALLVLEDPFTLLLFTGLAYWLFSGLMGLAVLRLRRSDPERDRPFRVWGYPVTPIVFIASAAGMMLSVVITDTRNALATVGILGAGFVLFAIQQRSAERSEGSTDG